MVILLGPCQKFPCDVLVRSVNEELEEVCCEDETRNCKSFDHPTFFDTHTHIYIIYTYTFRVLVCVFGDRWRTAHLLSGRLGLVGSVGGATREVQRKVPATGIFAPSQASCH